jgi:uncharacterized protein
LKRPLSSEPAELWSFLKNYQAEIIVLCSTGLFLSLARYRPVVNEWFNSLLYYLVLPVLVIYLLLRKNPLDFGFRIGNFKYWGPLVGITLLVLTPILLISSRFASLQAYYRVEHFNFTQYFLINFFSLLAWEFLFRGFLLLGLKNRFKEGAILIQMIPFVIVHFWKPELETYSTIITGIYFGYVCYKGHSFWPAFIIHLFINVFFVSIVNLI